MPEPASKRITFRCHVGLEGLGIIRQEWDTVVSGLTHPRFHHLYCWHDAYVRALARDPGSLRFYVGYADEAPIAVFPLISASDRMGGLAVRTLGIPTHNHLPLRDFVFEPHPSNVALVSEFIGHLRQDRSERWDVLVMRDLLDDSAAWRSVSGARPARTISGPATNVDYLECMPFESRLETLSKNFRASLRKSRNKLAHEPQVEIVRARSPEDVPPAFEEFLAVEASGWKGAAGSAIRCDPRLTAFYRLVAEGFAALGGAEINILKVGGRCVAAQLCLIVDRCLYILKIGYDESHSKLAPGNALLEKILRRSGLDRDVDSINLISDATWHADWSPKSYSRCSALVFNDTIRGRAAYVMSKAKVRVRPLYHKYVRPYVGSRMPRISKV